MKRISILVLLTLLVADSLSGQSVWVHISGDIPETAFNVAAVDPRDSKTIYVASAKRVYQSIDSGARWKKVLGVRGDDNEVTYLYVDPRASNNVYAGTVRGLHFSQDSGKHWTQIYNGIGQEAKKVNCVAKEPNDPKILWIGTSHGVILLNEATRELTRVTELPKKDVYSIIFQLSKDSRVILISTAQGIYRNKSQDIHRGWENVYTVTQNENSAETTTLQQFSVEEFFNPPLFSNLIAFNGKALAATKNGLWMSDTGSSGWKRMDGQNIPDQKINYIEKSSKTFYVATDKGIYQWDESHNKFDQIFEGLDSGQATSLTYSVSGDYLLASTPKGLYKMTHPEFIAPSITLAPSKEIASMNARQMLSQFSQEPSIRDVQDAAIHYAEVHPKKIEQWRQAASKKAFFPTLSLDTDYNRDQNVDIDRGGTNDPDKFIIGPEEKAWDWSVGVRWDLGELIWNNDQTSIDTRSKLMVELRDDILNEVTHFYYERRRLQLELAMSPPRDLAIQAEKELRLEELTAHIDALTGGFFSQKLNEAVVPLAQ